MKHFFKGEKMDPATISYIAFGVVFVLFGAIKFFMFSGDKS